MNNPKIKNRLDELERQSCSIKHSLDLLRTEIENESAPQIDYSSWVGKAVWVTDDDNKKDVRLKYFNKYLAEQNLRFDCVSHKADLNDLTQVSASDWKYCRLIRDFEDLQKGEW